MATEVDICNLALGHIGEDATLSSLNPPEGSAFADHCAQFYPIARDVLLEMHPWLFASKRIDAAEIDIEALGYTEWQYGYTMPTNCLKVWAVLPEGATSDTIAPSSSALTTNIDGGYVQPAVGGMYMPQDFETEALQDGTLVVLTNTENARMRYTSRIKDTSKFSPTFTLGLSWMVASFIAGPIIKGDVGAKEADRCFKTCMTVIGMGKQSDSNQRQSRPQAITPWLAGRG